MEGKPSQQAGLITPIIDNMVKAPNLYSPYNNFSNFRVVQEQRILTPPLDKLNISLTFAELVVGKTNSLNEWVMRIAADLKGEDVTDLDAQSLEVEGLEVEVFTASWIDFIRGAVVNGLVPAVNLGDWEKEHLDTISFVAKRAIDLARFGWGDRDGIEGRKIGLMGLDIPMVTATHRLGESNPDEYLGYNRFYTTFRELLKDENLAPNIFAAGLVTSGLSMERRIRERAALTGIKTEKELEGWLKRSHISVNKGYREFLLGYLPTNSGTTHTARMVRLEANRVMLEAYENDQIELDEEQYTLLMEEIRHLELGGEISDSEIIQNQGDRNEILTTQFYPDMVRGANLPPEQAYFGVNDDVGEVFLYPTLPMHNWVKEILNTNPKLLIP